MINKITYTKTNLKIKFQTKKKKLEKNRSYYNFFGLRRYNIKKYSSCEMLPGITKSSW